MREQGQKLMAALAIVVGGLKSWERVEPTVRALGQRHVGFGVKPEHYDTVAAALLWTLELGLAEAVTDEVKEAWTAAYQTIAATMIDAAPRPPPVAWDRGTRINIARGFAQTK